VSCNRGKAQSPVEDMMTILGWAASSHYLRNKVREILGGGGGWAGQVPTSLTAHTTEKAIIPVAASEAERKWQGLGQKCNQRWARKKAAGEGANQTEL